MAKNLRVLVLSILVCKIQSQAIEVNTNLQYSQFSFPSAYPSSIQTPPNAQPVSPTPVPMPSPPQQIPVALPPQYLPSPVPVSLPAQPFISAPVNQPPPPASVTLPSQPQIPPPTVTFPSPVSIPVPQPILQPKPIQPTVTLPAPLPTFQVSPPPSIPLFPPPVYVSPPPPIAIQELPVSVNVPTVIPSIPTLIPSPVIMSPYPIPMISTTVVDNSLANKLANVLQLFLVSKTIESNVNPYCNSPFFSDVTPFYDALGTIGTIYSPVTEVIPYPFYAPAYGVSDIAEPSIFGVESFGTVAEVLSAANIGAEVISPFGEYLTYSPFASDLLLPTQLAYNFPQIVDPALQQLVYY